MFEDLPLDLRSKVCAVTGLPRSPEFAQARPVPSSALSPPPFPGTQPAPGRRSGGEGDPGSWRGGYRAVKRNIRADRRCAWTVEANTQFFKLYHYHSIIFQFIMYICIICSNHTYSTKQFCRPVCVFIKNEQLFILFPSIFIKQELIKPAHRNQLPDPVIPQLDCCCAAMQVCCCSETLSGSKLVARPLVR